MDGVRADAALMAVFFHYGGPVFLQADLRCARRSHPGFVAVVPIYAVSVGLMLPSLLVPGLLQLLLSALPMAVGPAELCHRFVELPMIERGRSQRTVTEPLATRSYLV